jgi:hypothetical protein
VLWRDLYVYNFVDLDPGPGIRDWACGSQSYDGHTGEDSTIRSFREMDIGVPVFAALDGRVLSVQDGFYDRQFGPGRPPYDNHVVLQHGPGHFTVYGHLRRGIALKRGQMVRAGQQIGWTGSSGNSSWPHLHFTLQVDSQVEEPFAGACRPGPSSWASQVQLPSQPYVRDLALSALPLTGQADLPYDKAARTGTFVRGKRVVRFRLELGAAFEATMIRVRILRPDGSPAADSTRPIGFALPHGSGYGRFSYPVMLEPVGLWQLLVDIDGAQLVDAPFDVVASPSHVVNRRPNAVSASITTSPSAGDIVRCEVASSLVTEDPDYQIIRYRYRWTIDGTVVRTVRSAALSDMIRRGLTRSGQQVACAVTPSDGHLNGPTATASTAVH